MTNEPVQLSLVDGPFHGTVTPIEAPPPSWPAEAWKVLEVLRRVNKKDPLRTRNQLAMLTGLGLPAVDSALRHLAAYERPAGRGAECRGLAPWPARSGHLQALGATLMDYEILMRVRKPGVRSNALARKREPQELFGEVCDALKDNGWEIVGIVSVRPLEKYL